MGRTRVDITISMSVPDSDYLLQHASMTYARMGVQHEPAEWVRLALGRALQEHAEQWLAQYPGLVRPGEVMSW